MALDTSDLPLSPAEARAARNYLGMSQRDAAAKSGLLLHKIKQFETGSYNPDAGFLQQLKDFYADQGYPFNDPQAGDAKKADGTVITDGVIGTKQADTPPGKKVSSTIQHMRIDPSLPLEEVDNMLEHIDRNEERIQTLLSKKVAPAGLLTVGDYSAQTAGLHAQITRLLAENGTLFARLFGRELVEAPSPELAAGKEKPKTQGDLLAKQQADMHGAVAGDKDATAKVKARKDQPEDILDGLLGAFGL